MGIGGGAVGLCERSLLCSDVLSVTCYSRGQDPHVKALHETQTGEGNTTSVTAEGQAGTRDLKRNVQSRECLGKNWYSGVDFLFSPPRPRLRPHKRRTQIRPQVESTQP